MKVPVLITFLLVVSTALAAPPVPDKSPVSADDSLRHFQLPDDLAIELAAAEPEVVDPIDVRFDERGRMYVVEMRDYPLGPKPGQPPLSKIKLLEDRDGDGRYETAFVFAENLLFPTGLQPWKGGVIVTLAGRVIYLKDTDGDHKADLEETWFTGFAQENSQLRANHPRFAHDNHIYIANGLRGGKIVDVRAGVPPSGGKEPPEGGTPTIDISGRDLRFDPRGTLAEAVSGVGQYGLCFDDFGHRFVCQNRNPVQHVVFEERDLKKSKHYTPPAVMNDVAAFAEKSKLFPLTKTWTTSNLHENTFTAACGVNIYRGNALPEKFRGLALTCDPTGNLVHAERMEPWGPTFRSKPLYADREFLASTDEWFRPVAIENGPDGALYVVDMYRAVIEHPDWVPDELKRRPDERFGDDRGRIYRIVKKGPRPAKPDLLGKSSPQELVQLLAHENAWQRETAQRLLIERGEKDVVEQVAKLLKRDQPQTVFHALWTLQGLGILTEQHLAIALGEGDRKDLPAVIGLGQLIEVSGIANENKLRAALDNPFIETDLPFFLAMTPLSFAESRDAAARMTLSYNDPWSATLLLMVVRENAFDIWISIVANERFRVEDAHHRQITRGLLKLVAVQDVTNRTEVLHRLHDLYALTKDVSVVTEGLLGYSAGLRTRNVRLNDPGLDEVANEFLSNILREAANNSALSQLGRIELYEAIPGPNAKVGLAGFVKADDQAIRAAAIKGLLAMASEREADRLLSQARSESPAVKRVILEGLIARPATLTLLFDAIDKQELQITDIDPTLVPRIVNVADPVLKARAQKLFAPPPSADLQKTLAEYSAALKPDVDSKSGRVHFEKHCATCHKVGDVGVDVAPDISDSRTKTAQQILLDVLQPNRAVDGNYVAYVVTRTDGQVLTGVISAETSQAITLKQPGGMTVVVPRSEIDELQSTGKSLMPEGLERNIPPTEMAQLVAYIKNWRYLDGRVPASGAK